MSIKEVHQQMKFFINAVVNSVIKFYGIEIRQIVGSTDVKREIISNLVTNLVLSDELYFLIFNLISMAN